LTVAPFLNVPCRGEIVTLYFCHRIVASAALAGSDADSANPRTAATKANRLMLYTLRCVMSSRFPGVLFGAALNPHEPFSY
jgi:hypothetical protein